MCPPASPLAETTASGQPQGAAQPRAAGQQRRPVQGHRRQVARRVHHADAHLLLVLLGPVGRACHRGRDRGHQTGGGQPPRRLLAAAGQVQDACRQPGADGSLDKQRVQRVPEPDAVQPVTYLSRPDQPGGTLARGDQLVQAGVPLETRNQLHASPGFPRLGRLNRQARTGQAHAW